jgi:hypothetical protein
MALGGGWGRMAGRTRGCTPAPLLLTSIADLIQNQVHHQLSKSRMAARNVLLHLLKVLGAHGAAAGAVRQAGQEGAQLTGQVPADATRLQDTARKRAVTSAAQL